MLKTIFIVCACVLSVLAKHEIYDGHSVYEVNVKQLKDAQFVNDLENELELDVWSHAIPGQPGQVLVPKEKKQEFQNKLNAAGVEYKIEVENIREKLLLEDELLAAAARFSNKSASSISFNQIYRYAEVDQYLENIARQYPNVVTLVNAGRSVEGRDIKYLRISTTNFQDRRKPIVMMQSLLHAREWVTLPVTLYAIEKLVVDVVDRDLVEDIDWIILPIANPDGYEHTHTNSRFWRKNRSTGALCRGVDLNRNFDIFWGTASSASSCSDTFHGPRAFSEPETAAIRDIIAEHGSRIELFLDIHSFGSMILYGYGNGVLPPNGLIVNLAAINMATAIDAVKWPSNPNYIVGNVAMVLYQASGSAADYAMGTGSSLSYTFELPAYRNSGQTLQGFLVDPEFIEQAGFETWEAIKVGARFARDSL